MNDNIRYALMECGPNLSKPLQGIRRRGVFDDMVQAERHAQSLGLESGKYFISETFSAPGVSKYFSGGSK